MTEIFEVVIIPSMIGKAPVKICVKKVDICGAIV
jgi:hypothetical protein